MATDFYALSIKDTIKELSTTHNGLTDNEAQSRLLSLGKNELPYKKSSPAVILILKQFNNPIVYILFFASFISLLTGHFFDGFFIIFIVLVSVVIGFIQEKKADDAIAKLRDMIKYEIEVLRDGHHKIIPTSEVVVGDIIILKQGDKIPADARVFNINNFETSEAVLTGESMPNTKQVEKLDLEIPLSERVNMVYAGTIVVRGEGEALVTAIATNTELGKISKLVDYVEETESPLQKKIRIFSRNLGIGLVLLNVLIFLFGALMQRDLYEMFLISVAVVVAAIPEGLLPAMIVVLAIGMQKILKKGGLVKKIMAVETLGSVSVICTDKTGTLTRGEMRVDQIITEDNILKSGSEGLKNLSIKELASHYLALKISLLCNNVFTEETKDKTQEPIIRGSSTEKALYLAAIQSGLNKEELEKVEKKLVEIPFDSDYKFMATLHHLDPYTNFNRNNKKEEFIVYVKGAPERVIGLSSHIRINNKKEILSDSYKNKINKQYINLTSKGLRVIAVGYKEIESESKIGKGIISGYSKEKSFHLYPDDINSIVFVGFIALADPLRPDAKEAINNCLSAGIRPIIITGDHKLTAKTIYNDLGLKIEDSNILDGTELDKISDEELSRILVDISIYARVEPRHKIRIVKLWQEKGEIVAMTGDGVNDSPAIKAADIGIALGSGTDIAKETADLVLIHDSFNVIIESVRRGRIIFYNIKKVILYLLTGSFTEMILVSGSVIFGWPLPILPAQILWIKMIEDTTPAMALAFDEVDEDVMNDKVNKKKVLLNKNSIKLIAFYASIMDLSLLGLFYYYNETYNDIDYARTMTFVGLGIASLFYIYSVRGLKKNIFQINFFSNKFLTFSSVLGILMFVLAIYLPILNNILKTVPLSLNDWIVLSAYGFMGIIIYEIGKKIFKQT